MTEGTPEFYTKFQIAGAVVSLSLPFGFEVEDAARELASMKELLENLPEGVIAFGSKTAQATKTQETPAETEFNKPPAPPAPPAAPGQEVKNASDAREGDLFKVFGLANMEISPRPDGLTSVEMYGNDILQPRNKYPYLKTAMKPETFVKRFENSGVQLSAEDFTRPQIIEFGDIQPVVTVVWGRETGQGGRYKNLRSVVANPSGPSVARQADAVAEDGPPLFDDQEIPF